MLCDTIIIIFFSIEKGKIDNKCMKCIRGFHAGLLFIEEYKIVDNGGGMDGS